MTVNLPASFLTTENTKDPFDFCTNSFASFISFLDAYVVCCVGSRQVDITADDTLREFTTHVKENQGTLHVLFMLGR